MKKKKLKLNNLKVKSFLMFLDEDARATIVGAAINNPNMSKITCWSVCNACPEDKLTIKCSNVCPQISSACSMPPGCQGTGI
mgnify:CR=1 FL=1